MWCIGEITPEYAARMEELLDLYEKPFDAQEPVVCLDEKSVQLNADVQLPIPTSRPGQILKRDAEYVRCGTANIFCAVEPKGGKHLAKVTKRRKRKDFAKMLCLIESKYSRAKTIHLVLDNLNTHNVKSLIAQYGVERGTQLWGRFTVHYTPKHGSWLNQAEIEIGLMSRQALGKDRFPTRWSLRHRVTAWTDRVNGEKLKIDWSFTTKRARDKFKYRKLNDLL